MELLEFELAATAYGALAALEPGNAAWAECEAKAREMGGMSAYEVLGLPRSADAAAVRRAYHAQCLQWHPDKHQASEEARRRANTMFQRISAAHELLSDEMRRAEYNMQLQLSELRGAAPYKEPYAKDPSPPRDFDNFEQRARSGRAAPFGEYGSPPAAAPSYAPPAKENSFGRGNEGGYGGAKAYVPRSQTYAHRWSAGNAYEPGEVRADFDF